MFTKATKQQSKLRLALMGPSGSGKTYTALKIASELGGKIALIDTEHGSAAKYADEFDFDTVSLTDFHPDHYIAAMREAYRAQYDVLIIDSISHAWDAVLDIVDQAAKRSKSNNTFMAWKEGTPVQNAFIQAMLKYNGHIIATMRSKTEYVIEANDRGKQTPRKVGMAPIQRQGVEYEFDVVGELDHEHTFVVTKTRCRVLDQAVIKCADGVADTLKHWMADGVASTSHVDTATGEITNQTTGDDPKLAEAKDELKRVLNHASALGALSRESDLWPSANFVATMSLGQVYDHTEAVIAFTEAWQQQQATENTDQDNKTELFAEPAL